METRAPSSPAVPVHHARALLVGATLLWGLSFPLLRGIEIAQKAGAPTVSDGILACGDMGARFGLAAILLLPVYGRDLLRITSREWSQGTGLAFFGGAGLYLQTLGLAWTDASVSAFLTQLYTLTVPLIVAVRDRRWPTLRTVFACVLVMVGAGILSPGLLSHLALAWGEIIIILSTLFFAAQIVWVERPKYAENRAGVVSLIMFALIGVAFALIYPCLGETFSTAMGLFGSRAIGELFLAFVFFCTVLNYFIMNNWQRWVGATEAGLIYCLEPVIAAFLCSFVPGWISRLAGIDYADEKVTWTLLLGGTLIVGATILVATARRPSSSSDADQPIENR